jgi:hypothetical protein
VKQVGKSVAESSAAYVKSLVKVKDGPQVGSLQEVTLTSTVGTEVEGKVKETTKKLFEKLFE